MARFSGKTRSALLVSSASLVFTCMLAASTLFSSLNAYARPVQPHFNLFLSTHYNDDQYADNNLANNLVNGAAQQAYDDRAYPQKSVDYNQVIGSFNAYQSVARQPFAMSGSEHSWQQVGPTTTQVPGPVTYTGNPTLTSGRVTALAVGNSCTVELCRIWLGAAGGGIWETNHGLATTPDWHPSSNGMASNAIGSIVVDPTDPSGRTLYAGTGEANGSSDSEAGVGLYKSTDFGASWQLVRGSISASKDRAIGAIAIDPVNSRHIYIGTDVARHGSSSVNGGRFTPPGAPVIGLYESTNGGATFQLVFSKGADVVNPGSPNGSDFFRGGVSKILFDRTGIAANQPSVAYFSMFDYGLFRAINGSFEQVFASSGGGTVANSAGARTEFALAPLGNGKLRIYVGDTDGVTAGLYRVDDASVAASTLTDGVKNPGWVALSNPNPGTPGFASYNFCNGQCSYDMWVASPAGHPDTVWLGGSMQYGEIFTANPPSNGRAVQRSTDAGVDFTDMTDASNNPPTGMHPDQHAVAFDPANPDIAFLGSDGGIVRTNGSFADTSSTCASRGISGADLTDCQAWLKAVPTQINTLNAGLSTLQFQSVSVDPQHPLTDVIGGTQDNGTIAYSGTSTGMESVGGDGGQSAINASSPNIRMHTYYGPTGDVNFNTNNPLGWDYVTAPLDNSGEAASFYIPLIGDPTVGGTDFAGLAHVWRTQDNGGSQAYLDKNCNEFLPAYTGTCGDWVPLGNSLVDSTYGTDKAGSYVVAITRAPSDKSTLWTATRRGRLFISTNADAAASSVNFTRLDTSAQPTRFISGIAVDPQNPYHAFVSFSGYDAYTPTTTGHVFEVWYNPTTKAATWKDISHNLGDAPITSIAYDSATGDLYAANDFGVLILRKHSDHWSNAAPGLPMVAVYGLTLSSNGHVLYAATHGRGIWRLNL